MSKWRSFQSFFLDQGMRLWVTYISDISDASVRKNKDFILSDTTIRCSRDLRNPQPQSANQRRFERYTRPDQNRKASSLFQQHRLDDGVDFVKNLLHVINRLAKFMESNTINLATLLRTSTAFLTNSTPSSSLCCWKSQVMALSAFERYTRPDLKSYADRYGNVYQ